MQDRSDVFILGAGFSKQIWASMPTLRELGEMVAQAPGFESPDIPSPSVLGNDVELLLTYLSQEHPWQHAGETHRNMALFLELQKRIAEPIRAAEAEADLEQTPSWLGQLIGNWHEQRSTVVTLNYDTLIERRAHEFVDRDVKVTHMWSVPLTRLEGRMSGIYGGDWADTFHLLKLHGSYNWLYSGSTDFSGDQIYYLWDLKANGPDIDAEATMLAVDKVPLIIPPVAEKSRFYQHDTVQAIWRQAAIGLRDATRAVCMGYSLPTTDLTIRYLLASARPDPGTQLDIVCMVADEGERRDLIRRYEDVASPLGYVLDTTHVLVSPEEPIPAFVEEYCQDDPPGGQ